MRLDPESLKKGYPDMSPAFAENMRRMVRALPSMTEEKVVKKKISFAMVLAMILVALMAGAALAAGTGVLDYIFGANATPTEKQQALVRTVGVKAASDGVSTAVTEALLDGTRLDLAYQFDTDRPVWVERLGVTVNGVPATGMTTDVLNQWIMNPFETGRKTVTGGETLALDAPVTGETKIVVRLALLVPGGEVVKTEREDRDAVIAAGKVAVIPGDYDGYEILYSSRAADDPEDNATYEKLYPYYNLEAERELTAAEQAEVKRLEDAMMTMPEIYVKYGNMTLLDEVTLEFTLNGGEAEVVKLSYVQMDGLPEHFRAVIDRAEIGTMGMNVSLRLYEKAGGWTRQEITDKVFLFDFYDEMRQPIKYQDTWSEMDGGGDSFDENDVWYWEMLCHMPAPETLPKMIYAVPYSLGERDNPLWQDAIPLFPGDPEDLNG